MIAALALAAAIASTSPRIVIASDSTAANYSPSQYPQMGWGMVLKCSLDPTVEVVNLARGGRSTKTFIEEGLWDQLVAQLRPGDTVLIQFGHNDADTKKIARFLSPAPEVSAPVRVDADFALKNRAPRRRLATGTVVTSSSPRSTRTAWSTRVR